jgi:hypothetical protein
MQLESAVRLAAVQENRDRGDGHMGEGKGNQDQAPPRQIKPTGKHHEMDGL